MRAPRTGLLQRAGSTARLRVIVLLAAVLALSGTDTGTISAVTSNLERAFGMSNTGIGILLSAVMLTGAAGTIPAGSLTDKVNRTHLLAASIGLWATATVASAVATSFTWLLVARVVLGIVTATAGPAVASLAGDYFPAAERGRIWGWVVSGEVLGLAVGLVISGSVASAVGWRAAIAWAALPSLVLAWTVLRLPEPRRRGGGQFCASVAAAHGAQQSPSRDADPAVPAGAALEGLGRVDELAKQRHVRPSAKLVLHSDPASRSLWWAVRYVLAVRTNLVIVVASALAYFYLSGVNGFALLYAQHHYRVSQTAATLVVIAIGAGTMAGVLIGGRVSDRLLRRGLLNARVIVPMAALLASLPFLALGFMSSSLLTAIPLLMIGAFCLGAAGPPGDAARLDIIHPHLWGRSEGIRTFLRALLQATAPVAFGFASEHLPGANSGGQPGLEYTFVLFLAVLVLAGLAILPALRTYPRDVATADASIHAVAAAARRTGPPQAALPPCGLSASPSDGTGRTHEPWPGTGPARSVLDRPVVRASHGHQRTARNRSGLRLDSSQKRR
jgi:MFS family permease